MRKLLTYPVLCWLLLLPLFAALPARAQQAETVLEPDNILIGEHTQMRLLIRYKQGTGKISYTFPTLTDTIGPWINIISPGVFDTTIVDSASLLTEISRKYTITSFDSGTYTIPSFPIVFNGVTVYTDSVQLTVNTIDVDTTKPIQDIKEKMDVPDAPVDYMKYVYWLLYALGAGTIIFVLVHITRRKRKGLPIFNFRSAALHEVFIARLNDLRKKQIWQRGDHKGFHSELTDILRQYIEKRWSIPAMEMTSDEIHGILRNRIDLEDESRHKLRRVLQLADMVKFAKEIPDGSENELSIDLGIAFLRETAVPLEPVPAKTDIPEMPAAKGKGKDKNKTTDAPPASDDEDSNEA